MGHNSRNKPGPTLEDAVARGATHIAVHCHETESRHKADVEIDGIKAPRNVAVNRLPFRCGKCRGINISVGLVIPQLAVIPVPVLDVNGLRPKKPRQIRAG